MPKDPAVPPKKKIICPDPDCGAEVELDDDGECPECGLDVSRVMEKVRYDKAVENVKQQQSEGQGKKKKKFDPFAE